MTRPTTHLYEFGSFRLDAVKRLLLRDGVVVPLKPKDIETLLVLIEHRGQVLAKEELMRKLWPNSIVEDGNLSVHIFAVRRALGESPEDHRYIVTVPGRGYSFVAEVCETPNSDRADEQASAISLPDVAPLNRFGQLGQLRQLEPVGGAVSLDSTFYIARQTDNEFQTAVERRDSIVLVKGARRWARPRCWRAVCNGRVKRARESH